MVGLERLLIGRTLDGRYTIEELIGHGRGGLVYRARHGQTGVEVALKVLAAPRTPEARERFRKMVGTEVKVAAAIEHPNVAGVYCLGHDPELDLDFVTSELLRGQTLASVLSQRGKPPIALGLRLLADAAEGLSAGHRAGLVHRDVRPASLYLVRSDSERQVRVKVAGFGVPQIVRRESLAGAAPEIGAYASPEILANGSLRLTPASDVFSLGVVGYELLTGSFPFDDAGRQALAQGRAVEAAPPHDVAASVPPQVVEAVLHALRSNPAERFADGAAFSAALQQTARTVVAVGKISPAAAPADVAAPEAAALPEPGVAAAVVAATDAPHAVTDAPVVDVSDLAVDEPEPDVAEAAPAIADEGPIAVPAVAVAAAAEPSPAAADAIAPAAQTPAAAAPAAPATPRPDLTRAPAKKPKTPDLELYYPPQLKKPPVAAPVMPPASPPVAAPAETVASAAPRVQPPVETAAPAATVVPPMPSAPAAPVAEVPTPVAPPMADAPTPAAVETPSIPVPVAEVPAYAPAEAAAPAVVTPLASTRRRQAAAVGGMRGSAMAAGFVLGIAVLGSVAWIATRRGHPADAVAAPVVNQLAQGSATTPSATPAQPAKDAEAAPAAAPADTASRTAEQRAADLRKKQQDDERRRQEEEKQRQAQLLQQQQLAQQQAAARAGAQPATPQPAPAQPPQQLAVAQPQRPAAQPVAPPPAPPPAPAAREEPANEAPASNAVFGEDAVDERARLANGSELQRALQSRYPQQLEAARISGRVTASFVVGADGRVDPGSIRIVSSPNPGFNDPTASVLRRARFRPARVKGQAVRSQMSMSITWNAEQ